MHAAVWIYGRLLYLPMPPQALGDDIEVPFISCDPFKVQLGTEVIAPPGAVILTPKAPSTLWKLK